MKSIILVPHLNGIDDRCESGLKLLEAAGLKVWRLPGCSGIDRARNKMVSEPLMDGYDSMFFIDADVSFNTADVFKLLDRPEPVISGVYAIKGARRFASVFDGITEVTFGKGAPESYPLVYAATGFLRIKADVLRQMIEFFKFPFCDTKWGRGFWPFFLPLVVPEGDIVHYLGEDWAFCHRLRQMGITPLADTSIRLFHWNKDYGFGWEDAGGSKGRFETYRFRCNY